MRASPFVIVLLFNFCSSYAFASNEGEHTEPGSSEREVAQTSQKHEVKHHKTQGTFDRASATVGTKNLDNKKEYIPKKDVCAAFGSGFIPLKDLSTCFAISGRVRLDTGYFHGYPSSSAVDRTMYAGYGRFGIETMTNTEYGLLRTFLRIEAGAYTGVMSTENFFGVSGQNLDAFGHSKLSVNLRDAFIQYFGFTVGRTASFFDFYAHDYEFFGITTGSDVASTNLLAYTWAFNDKLHMTVSMEDPTPRRSGMYSVSDPRSSVMNIPAVDVDPSTGDKIYTVYSRDQRVTYPDFVSALRYDSSWGSAQISGALKQVGTGNMEHFYGNFPDIYMTHDAELPDKPINTLGWALQAGVRFNLPMVSAQDGLYLQAGFGQGANSYTGVSLYGNTNYPYAHAAFRAFAPDAVLDPYTKKIVTTTSASVTASYLHYWSPQFRSAFFQSFDTIRIPESIRRAYGQLGVESDQLDGNYFPGKPDSPQYQYSDVLRSSYQSFTGANIVWTPEKNLDIGLELAYGRTFFANGKVVDRSKSDAQVDHIVNGIPYDENGKPVPVVGSEHTFQVLARIQRDF